MPTGAVENFILDLERISPACRHAVLIGGNGTNKTNFMVNACILGLLLPKIYNPWLARSAFHNNKSKWANFFGPNGSLIIYGLFRADTIETVIMPELQRWAPKGSFTVETARKVFTHKIYFQDGGMMINFTPNQDVKQMQGGNADLILKDEQFPLTAHRELMKRLRMRGADISVMTALWDADASAFMDEMYEKPAEERIIHTVTLDTACKRCGTRGIWNHDECEREKKDTDPEEYNARILGIPMFLAGKVFPKVNEVHLIDELTAVGLAREYGATFYGSCDPHDAILNLMGWAIRLGNGDLIWVWEWPMWDPAAEFKIQLNETNWLEFYTLPRPTRYDKLPKQSMGPDIFCPIVKAIERKILDRYTGGKGAHDQPKYPKVNPYIKKRYIDPRKGAAPSGQTAIDLIQIYKKEGVRFVASSGEGDLKPNHDKIRKLLAYEKDAEDDITSPPKMYFVEERTRNLFYAISNVAFEAKMERGAYSGNLDESKITKKLKHGVDVVRYAVQKALPYRETDLLVKERCQREREAKPPQTIFARF